jgi:hypothetical protein
MADKSKLIDAEAKAIQNLANLQEKLAEATAAQDSAQISALDEKIKKINDFIGRTKGIRESISNFKDLTTQMSLAGNVTSDMGKELTLMAKQVNKIGSISIDVGDVDTANFVKDFMAGADMLTQAQNELMHASASGDSDAMKAATENLDIAKKMYVDLIKSSDSVFSNNKDIARAVQDFGAAQSKVNKAMQATIGLTEDELDAYKELTEEANRMQARFNAVANQITTALKKPQVAIGLMVMGVGTFVNKLGEVRSQLGGLTEFATTGLAFFDDNAVENAKALASEFGGMNNVSGELQASTSLISKNMGISGTEAAGLLGSFSRLNGNSEEAALNLTKSTQEFAKQNGIIPAALMADLAGSAEEFALFGKDGGENIIKAAAAAAKMGVSLKTMTGIADNLLDFETSITKELELGALMGKNINLDRARALAFEGKIEEATQETLNALGGVDAFNKMDYFQKKATADLLGISVAELGKMAANQENATTLTGQMNSQFSMINETIQAGMNTGLGSFIQLLGGGIMTGVQFGGALGQMGVKFTKLGEYAKSIGSTMGGWVKTSAEFIKNMASNVLQKFMGGGAVSTATQSIADVAGGSLADKAKETIQDKASGKVEDLVDNKIDSVTSPEGVEQATESMNKDKSMGDKLKDLASGLKAMGNAKVLFGALNLIPTGIGFALMSVGLPTLFVLSKIDISTVGTGLKSLAKGLSAFGDAKVLAGAGVLAVAGLAFAIMTVGSLGLAAIALGGEAAAIGLIALAGGLTAFGASAPGTLIGIGLLALFGASLIPLTYALSLLAPLIESIGKSIGTVVESIGKGIASVVGSIGDLMVKILPLLSMDAAAALFAMAGGFIALSASMASFAVAGLLAIPAMLAVGTFLEIGGGSVIETLNGGGEGGKGAEDKNAKMDELINEIKALRTDLNSGKIAVHMDGKKVTSGVSKVVSTVSSNSYALK